MPTHEILLFHRLSVQISLLTCEVTFFTSFNFNLLTKSILSIWRIRTSQRCRLTPVVGVWSSRLPAASPSLVWERKLVWVLVQVGEPVSSSGLVYETSWGERPTWLSYYASPSSQCSRQPDLRNPPQYAGSTSIVWSLGSYFSSQWVQVPPLQPVL